MIVIVIVGVARGRAVWAAVVFVGGARAVWIRCSDAACWGLVFGSRVSSCLWTATWANTPFIVALSSPSSTNPLPASLAGWAASSLGRRWSRDVGAMVVMLSTPVQC